MDVLAQLSTTGNPTLDEFEERFDVMKKTGNYFLVCIEAEDRIVACATLILEHKFLHGCGQVRHNRKSLHYNSRTLCVLLLFLYECRQVTSRTSLWMVHSEAKSLASGKPDIKYIVHHAHRLYRLIEQLQYMAEQLQCYKVLLNCTEKNVPFYEKCHLTRAQVQMTHYFHPSDNH